jgi:hypothetical protein
MTHINAIEYPCMEFSDCVFLKQIEYLLSLSEQENILMPEILGQMRIITRCDSFGFLTFKELQSWGGYDNAWITLGVWNNGAP